MIRLTHAALAAAFAFGICALVALPVTARAGDVLAFEPNAHALADSLDAGEEHYVPLDLPEGASLSFQFRVNRKLNKSSQLVPEAELVRPDGTSVDIPSDLIKSKKGFDVKNLPVDQTGRHILILRGATSAPGPYTLKVKAKYPSKLSGVLDGSSGPLEIPFACTKGGSVTAKVSGSKGGAVPELPRVRQPNLNEFGPPNNKDKSSGFNFKNFEQTGEFGVYALTFKLRPGTTAGDKTFKYKISVKWPKAAKRSLAYSDVVVSPLVTSLTPNDVPISADPVDLRLEGRFFQPGASIFLELAGQPDWRPRNAVATEGTLTVPIETLGHAPGRWDVIAANPSGGQTELKRALLVRPATPSIVSVTPSTTTDDRTTATVLVIGGQISTTTEFTFRRELPGGGTETFVPLSVKAASGGGLLVEFSPFRRPLGAYDMIVQNPGPLEDVPGSDQTTVTDAIEILNAAPRLTSATPDRHLSGGAFTMVVTGEEMESGAQAVLRREGETDVEANDETVSQDGTTLSAQFNMDGQTNGPWDLVVVNPDTQGSQIESAFAVTSPATATLTNKVIGEPALDLATEHDLGLVAWIESNETGGGGSSWVVRARLFDLQLNTWVSDPVDLSSALTSNASKRHVSASYNPDSDQWLVVWTEHTFCSYLNEKAQAGVSPTSGTVYQVYGRRVSVTGSATGNVIDFIDNTQTATSTTQYYDQFEYSNPQVVYAPWDGNWYMTFTQRWDNLSDNGSYINDDYDVFVWRLSKTDPKLDTSFHKAIHTTQNHESDCLAAVDTDRDELFIVGSCDSRQLKAVNTREIEAKWVTASGSIVFGPGGSNVGDVLSVSSRSGESEHFTNPRPAYNPDTGEFLVVYERKDEFDTGRIQIWARRVTATDRSVAGSEIVVGEDDAFDLRTPRAVYNPDLEEFLVTWTVDDTSGSGRARARRLDGADAQPLDDAFDVVDTDGGLPDVRVDTTRGNYVGVSVTQLGGFGGVLTGTGLRIDLFE